MIVLYAGMQKSGTGWYFNMLNELLVAAGHQDTRAIRSRYHLHPILRADNCYIDGLSLRRLGPIMIPNLLGNTFAIKTHSSPTPLFRHLTKAGWMKAIYSYRDPRDVALSFFEHLQHRSASGLPIPVQLNALEDAIRFIQPWLKTWEAWQQQDHVLLVRYESLVADTLRQLQQLTAHLGLNVSLEMLKQIQRNYQSENLDKKATQRLHFNQGTPGRFRQVLSKPQLDLCNRLYADYLPKMGYE